MPEALDDVPGIHVNKASSFGGQTDLYIRGAGSGNSVVLIDGVRILDPTSISKTINLTYFGTENIKRIEVVRGSQSTLYGADAIGGVVNIITKKGKGGPNFTLWSEAGAYNTFRERFGINGGNDSAYYTVTATREDSLGFNAIARAPSDGLNSDRDGYQRTAFTTRFGFELFEDSWLQFTFLFTDAIVEIDDGEFITGISNYNDDDNKRNYARIFTGIVKYNVPIFDWWESTIIFGHSNITRRYIDESDLTQTSLDEEDGWYRGHINRIEWRNQINIGENNEILIGGEFEQEMAATDYFFYNVWAMPAPEWQATQFNESAKTGAFYIQNHLKYLDRIFLIFGLRYTNAQGYTTTFSYNLSGSFIIPFIETRLKVNLGTGFKAPSLYQRYDATYGNTDLDPETSVSFDVGIVQPLFDELISFEISYFSIEYRDKIDFVFTPSPGHYENINDTSISRGIEGFLKFNVSDNLTLRTGYTHCITRDNDSGNWLYYRPRHRYTVNINFKFLERGNINIGYIYTGKHWDVKRRYPASPIAGSYIDGYHRLDARISFWIFEHFQVFFRGENLLNQDYEVIADYNTPKISFYGGLKAVF